MRGRIARLCPAGRCVFVLLVFTLLAAGRADAQWNGFIHINGGEQNVDRIVTNTLQVEIYDETATYEAAMTSPGGLVFDASVGVRVVGNLGVGIGATVLNARGMIALDGSVPSPLVRGRHRTASREQPGLKHQQIGVHIPVVYMVPVSERVQVALSAGPSWFRLRHDALATVTLSDEVAPYNMVSLTGLTTTVEEGFGIGYNTGLDVTFLLTRWFGAGVFARYTGGMVEIEMPGGLQSIDVGGLQAGAGLRFRF